MARRDWILTSDRFFHFPSPAFMDQPASSQLPDRLPPGQQLAAPGKWPVIGERTPAPNPGPWILRVCGCVERPLVLDLEQFSRLPRTALRLDIHCVTRWSIFDMDFSGVLLADLLALAGIGPSARFVSFRSQSMHDHSSSLELADAIEKGTLVANQAGGAPLTPEHGGPLRNIVPGKYFYKSVKWLKEICLLEQDHPGTWERESGYHNHADPWLEQRYIAPQIDKREAAMLIAQRDFSGRDLRSLLADRLDLSGLKANAAQLRDASFRGAILRDADFSQANLSNAHLELADLTGARFPGADVEGASFNGANLSGVDLRSASLIGCTFTGIDRKTGQTASATLDQTTCFTRSSLEALAAEQQQYILASPATIEP